MGIRTPYRAEERSFGGFSRNHMASSMSALQTHLATGQIQAFGSDPEICSLAAGMEMAGFDISSSKSAEACPKTLDDPLTGVDVLEFYGRPGFANWDDQNGDDSSLRWGFRGHGAAAGHHGLSLTLNTACHSDRIQVGGGCGSAGPVREVWNSKYLGPARELLSEICSVGVGVGVPEMYGRPPDPHQQKNGGRNTDRVRREYINACGSSSRARPACPQLDFVALHKRKTKLLSMLDELEGRYRRYRDRMGAVASSFEAAAGGGAAAVYTAVASNVMSRHFRRLRDGIVDQIRDTRETEPQANRGETPRLRILDQTLRRRRAFRQMNTAEGGLVAWRPQRGLPDQSVTILRAWLFEHFLHPYPSDIDKHILARQSGLSRSQVSNWFINARVRLWKPMVEEMYLEETKARDGPDASNPTGTNEQEGRGTSSTPKEPLLPRSQLLPAANPDCLSSILGGADPEKTPSVEKVKPHSRLGGVCGVESPPFEAVEMDFIDYSYGHRTMGGGVSLTLGLQQPPPGGGGDGGGRFEFPAAQGSLLYSSRGGRPVPYSILEGGGEVPYPGVVGAQLLHQFDPCDDLGNYQADIGSAGDPTGRRYLPVGSPNKN